MAGPLQGAALTRRAALGGLVVATAGVLSSCGSTHRSAGASTSSASSTTTSRSSSSTSSTSSTSSPESTTSTSSTSSTSSPESTSSSSSPESTTSSTSQESPTSTESPSPTATQTETPDPGYGESGSTDATGTGTLKIGSSGSDVKAMQVALLNLGFWINGQDGTFGPSTQQAVWAFQKAYGLTRTGRFTDHERKVLASARRITPKLSGTRIEIDKTRQLLIVNVGGRAAWVFNTSTGWNQPFVVKGHTFNGRTPSGSFEVYRIFGSGWKTNELGSLYRPYFFNGAIAVHGAPQVPPYNASHGCCRVSIAAQDFMIKQGYLAMNRDVDVY